MGQTVSTTTRFNDRLESLGIDRDMVGYTGEDNDNDDEEIVPSAELTVPLDNRLLDRYSLNHFEQVIEEHFVLYVTQESFVCGHEIEADLNTQYNVIVMQAYSISDDDDDDDAVGNLYVYEIHPASRADAEIILNALLHLSARTPTFTDLKSLSITVRMDQHDFIDRPLVINYDNLRTFLGRGTTNGCRIQFSGMKFNSEQGELLSSPALQANACIELSSCEFEDNGVAFAQGLANNNGPANLEIYDFEHTIAREKYISFFTNICTALENRKNTRLKRFCCDLDMNESALLSLQTMLESNTGLVALYLFNNDISSKKSFWQCLHNHPTLECLKAISFISSSLSISDKERVQRTEPLIELVKKNSVLKEIELYHEGQQSTHCYDERLIGTEVRPRLEINRYRPRFIQIRNELNDRIRSRLLGDFLVDTRLNLSLIWLVVRDNHDLIIDIFQQTDDSDAVEAATKPPFKHRRFSKIIEP